MKNSFVLLFFLFSGIFFSSFAENEVSINDTILIKEVVITGTPVKVSRGHVPMSVSILNQAQIAESDESALLPVLSGRIPGLFVTERGITGFGVSAGSAGQITIRGVGSNPTTGVLMLIDGHPQFMGIFGHPLPDSYVASDVERVEVIRGPGSVLYGSNAMGGVINIITKKQDREGLNGNARLMYGSFSTQKYMGSAGYRKNKLSVFGSINHDHTDGHRDHSDFSITNGYLKTSYELSKNWHATADFNLAGFKSSDPGPNKPGGTAGAEIDITRGYGAASLHNEFEKISGSARYYYNFGEHDVTDGFHSTDQNFGLNLYESFRFFKGNTLTFGVDYANYGGMAENLLAMQGQGVVFADTTVYELAFYGFVQQNFSEKLSLSAGLRYSEHRTYGNEWIPSFGATYQIGKSTGWKVIVSKGFRSPTMRELFMWGTSLHLKPENIWNYETSILHSLPNNKLNVELTGFILKGDNLIQQVPNQGYQNSGEISNKGIELAADGKINKQAGFHIAYSYIQMKTPVFATPEHQLFISGNYRLRNLTLTASLQQVSGLDTDVSEAVSKESYTLLGAKASYRLTKHIQWFISGENLLNQEYETIRYYSMPGATVFSGVNLNF
ncbi:MAG: TonB-dependent receptor [Prolixibacteraceae bacterium]|jgi:iron complex outermembrane receptor protein|nr:TonB-dependent receptor [Prolixibacteraceae bacterium]